jgi:hypothetical protein
LEAQDKPALSVGNIDEGDGWLTAKAIAREVTDSQHYCSMAWRWTMVCVINVATMAIHPLRRRVESHQVFSRRKNLLVWGFALAILFAIALALLFTN